MEPTVRWHIVLSGRVQGIGLRFRAKMFAQQRGITGWIANRSDGDVELEAQGSQTAVDIFLETVRTMPGVRVTFVHAEEIPICCESSFRIHSS